MNTAEITTGQNGYPQNIRRAIVADTMPELKELQDKYGGDLLCISQKNGWQLWQMDGSFSDDNLLNMPQNDSDTVIRYRTGEDINELAFGFVIGDYDSVTLALADIYPDATVDQAFDILKGWKERIEEITNTIIEGEDIDIWFRNPNPSDGIDFEITKDSVSYHSDVTTYRIALFVDNIDEIL